MRPERITPLVIIFAFCIMLLAHGCRNATDTHLLQNPPKWEYAELQRAFCRVDNSTATDPEERWLWATSSGDREWGDSIFRLHREMAGGAPGHSTVLAILKTIGERGWELVDYSQQSQPLNEAIRYRLKINREISTCQIQIWYFKHPVD